MLASDAEKIVDQNLELVNQMQIRNHSMEKKHVNLGAGSNTVALTILELTLKGETSLQIN